MAKEKIIAIRATEEEHEFVKKRAKKMNLSIGDMIRYEYILKIMKKEG